MKSVLLLTFLLFQGVGMAFGQTPYIGVYFDSGYSEEARSCAGIGVLDTLYVGAFNFNRFLGGAEFAVHYPPALTWISDLATPPATINNTPTGISMGFPAPQNGFSPVPLCQVLVIWNCDGCGDPFVADALRVIPSFWTGFLGAVDYPGFNLVPAVGLTALICPLVPTVDTTWGRVKAIYED
jgi:hypothetical protein